MKTITQKELLDFCYKDAKKIAESQFVEIDEDYQLTQSNLKFQPNISFEDNLYFISISVKYNTKPMVELTLTATKWIVKDGKYQDFDEVVA